MRFFTSTPWLFGFIFLWRVFFNIVIHVKECQYEADFCLHDEWLSLTTSHSILVILFPPFHVCIQSSTNVKIHVKTVADLWDSVRIPRASNQEVPLQQPKGFCSGTSWLLALEISLALSRLVEESSFFWSFWFLKAHGIQHEPRYASPKELELNVKKTVGTHRAFDIQSHCQGHPPAQITMSTKTATESWQSLSNTTITPAVWHCVKFPCQQVTRLTGRHVYPPWRNSVYFKLKTATSPQVSPCSDEGTKDCI